MGNRTVVLKRKTKETDIKLTLDMDAKGVEIDTPVAFFNHMLTAMAFHGGFALKVKADGDIDVDPHHLVEDIGLVLGDALAKCLEKGLCHVVAVLSVAAGAVECYLGSV